eukprot:UN22962
MNTSSPKRSRAPSNSLFHSSSRQHISPLRRRQTFESPPHSPINYRKANNINFPTTSYNSTRLDHKPEPFTNPISDPVSDNSSSMPITSNLWSSLTTSPQKEQMGLKPQLTIIAILT